MPNGFLPAPVLGRLRARAEADMNATCQVERRGDTRAYAVVSGLTALPCGFQAHAATTADTADDTDANVTRYLVRFPPRVFPVGGGVRSDDRLRITHTTPGVPSPLVLDVVGDQPGGTYEVTRRVLADRVDA